MKITEWRFTAWCSNATKFIDFPPDKKRVAQELRDHLDDHCASLMESGMSQEDAVKTTLEAMGDPFDIAPQLGALHRPFWGYFMKATRIIAMVLLALLLIPGYRFLAKQAFAPIGIDPQYWANNGYTPIFSAETGDSFKDRNNTLTLTKASLWQKEDEQVLYFEVTHRSPLPCSVAQNYSLFKNPAMTFWAEDNLGNYYYSYDSAFEDDLAIQVIRSQTGFFTWTYECWVNDLPEGVEWLNIHYDRDGRNHILFIDLTGGDGK